MLQRFEVFGMLLILNGYALGKSILEVPCNLDFNI